MTNRNHNTVSRRNISSAAARLRRNINAWMRKHRDDLDKNHEAIINSINKPLDQYSTDETFNKYKTFLKNLKKNKTKQKFNIRNFI